MRVKVAYRSTSKEVFERFKQANPDVKIEFKDWKNILYAFNYQFRDHLLETGNLVKMPHGLGPFSITKKKLKKFKNFKDKDGNNYVNLPIDWAKTKKAGKKIYHINAHTDGYKCSWLWQPKEARFYMSDIWNFKPSRKSSRLLKTYLSKPDSVYLDRYKIRQRK